jgi:hypothetical protein
MHTRKFRTTPIDPSRGERMQLDAIHIARAVSHSQIRNSTQGRPPEKEGNTLDRNRLCCQNWVSAIALSFFKHVIARTHRVMVKHASVQKNTSPLDHQ